jgi:aspartyl aminopeptidase
LGGLNNEFIFSARLDNLMMSFCSLMGLVESVGSVGCDKTIRVVGLFDNEEVGSTTAHGANSNLLESTLRRLSGISFGGGNVLKVFNSLSIESLYPFTNS